MDIDEPTVVISGRAAPRDIAVAVEYFKPRTRSDLVAQIFQLIVKIAELEGIKRPDTNHEAFEQMERRGIDWPGEAAQRDVQKARQFDVLADMSYEDALALKRQIMDQRRKGENLMPSAVSTEVQDEPPGLMDELEELDKELRGSDGGQE